MSGGSKFCVVSFWEKKKSRVLHTKQDESKASERSGTKFAGSARRERETHAGMSQNGKDAGRGLQRFKT